MMESERRFPSLESFGRRATVIIILIAGIYAYITHDEQGQLQVIPIETPMVPNTTEPLISENGSNFPAESQTSPTTQAAPENCTTNITEIPGWFLEEIGGPQVLKNFSSQQELVNYVNNLNPRVQDLKYEEVYYFPGELHSSPEIIIGSATFYSEDYKDKRTGFGDPYNPNLHTGATWLGVGGGLYQVTNLANCKSTYILANDRGPDRTHNGNTDRGRYVIDLSRAAFEDIANPSQGEIQIMARLVGFDALFEAAYPTIPPRKSSGIPPWHSGA